MSKVRYIGTQNPHQEQVVVGSEQQYITCVPNQVLTLSEAVGTYLVSHEPSQWEAAEGWTPPPFEPPEAENLTVTSGYTLGTSCKRLFCNAQAGGFTVKLPAATGLEGKEYVIVNTATNNNVVTIESLGGNITAPNFEPATTLRIGRPETYSSVTLIAAGGQWHVV